MLRNMRAGVGNPCRLLNTRPLSRCRDGCFFSRLGKALRDALPKDRLLARGANVSPVKVERPSWPTVRIPAEERALGRPYADAFEGRSRFLPLLPRGPDG